MIRALNSDYTNNKSNNCAKLLRFPEIRIRYGKPFGFQAVFVFKEANFYMKIEHSLQFRIHFVGIFLGGIEWWTASSPFIRSMCHLP